MTLIDLAKKFSANPSSCTDSEVAQLARDFNDAHPQIEAALAVGNAHKTKWDGLLSEIRRSHYERSNLEALSKNPFATESEIKAMPQPAPSELSGLSQNQLGAMIFGE